MKLFATLQPSVKASAVRAERHRDATQYADKLFRRISALRSYIIATSTNSFPRPAPVTFDQCLPAGHYRQGMTRRELRNLRKLSGLKRPHQVRSWVDKQRKPA